MSDVRVGLVGATGIVGTEVLRLLSERDFPVSELRVYASARSAGRVLAFGDGEVVCEVLREGCFDGLDLVIIDVEDELAREWAPRAVAAGARVIDKSAAFRLEDDVPLVVADVNPDDLHNMARGIASCPNCTTAIPMTALAPLHRAARIERMVVSTYQSVSGAGQAGVRELDAQWSEWTGAGARLSRAGAIGGFDTPGEVCVRPMAGNVVPMVGSVREAGYTSEEWKFMRETRKILHDDAIAATVTCVRVPVYVGHAISVNVTFGRPMTSAEAAELLEGAPGVRLVDGGAGFPTPLEAAGIDPVLVGRLREDPSLPGALDLWITGDNLRQGAALNSIRMAELLVM